MLPTSVSHESRKGESRVILRQRTFANKLFRANTYTLGDDSVIDEDIRAALAAEDAQLFTLLGDTLLEFEMGFGDAEQNPEELGRSWYQRFREKIRNAICGSRVVQLATSRGAEFDKVLLIAALADLLSQVFDKVPVTYVATLIVREGLDAYCLVSKSEHK